jgi:LmbE family N-acetylglucosaminyl deacetylase
MTMEAHTWRPGRFMVIAAHPDDADFGPAATAAKWIDAGSVGWLVCCTSGDAGGEDPNADPLELAAVREREQRAAAAVVGYAGVTFLHMPDGALANDLILREHLVREIRTFKPDAVLATDPENLFPRDAGVNHTDHRAAGYAAADAAYPAARNPMAFPSLARGGLAAHRVRRLYLFWTHKNTVYVDVTATVDRKIDALRCHESQLKDFDGVRERILAWTAELGSEIGVSAGEGFHLVIIDEDEESDGAPSDETEAAEVGATS